MTSGLYDLRDFRGDRRVQVAVSIGDLDIFSAWRFKYVERLALKGMFSPRTGECRRVYQSSRRV